MSPRSIALATLAVLACTSAEPPPDPPVVAPAEPVPLPVEPAPAPMPTPEPLPASTLPWVWYHAHPAELVEALSHVGTGPVAHDHRVGDHRRYTVRRDDRGLELVLERLPERGAKGKAVLVWTRRIATTAAVGEPVVLASMGPPSEVIVAVRIAGGYERHAFADDGSPRSSSVVMDPAEFAGRDVAIQIGGSYARPTVHVRGSNHAYLDEHDPATGQPVARAEFGPLVLFERFAWPPKSGLGRRLGRCWPVRDGGCHEVLRRGEALELRSVDLAGEERWRVVLDPRGGGWYDSAAVAETHDGVVVVAYHGISSGATAYGVDRERGTLRFSGSPGSIGNIGHSQYGNQVAAVVGDDDLVRVQGHESAGDYLGVLDPDTGLLGHEVWRR